MNRFLTLFFSFSFVISATLSSASVLNEECAWCSFFPPQLADGVYPHHYRPERTVDAEKLTLDLKVHLEEMKLEGSATYAVKPIHDGVTRIRMNAFELEISGVTTDFSAPRWNYADNHLTMEFNQPLPADRSTTITIEYSVSFENKKSSGISGVYFADTEQRIPPKYNQMHTLNEPFGAAKWFPCVDYPSDRMITEMNVTIPENYVSLSNGKLVESTSTGGWRTDYWKQEIPHVVYLVSLVVGEFSIVTEEWRGLPVEYYVEKGKEKDAKPSMGKVVNMLDFMSDYLDYPYPYEKYAQVHVRDFRAGGMEHTTATTLFEWAVIDEEARLDNEIDGLIAHELAHQWFGDLVTCESWGELWLNESFATFFDALWHEHYHGEAVYLHEIWNNAHAYFGEARRYQRAIRTNKFADPFEMFDSHSYPKGSVVLHALRNELGDGLFRKSLHNYLKKHEDGLVDTDDLQEAVEQTTGRPMDRFFEQWVQSPGHVKLKVSHDWLANHNQLKLRIQQTQEMEEGRPAFAFPLEIRIMAGDEIIEKTVPVSLKDETVFIACPAQPNGIEIDPKFHVLMELDYSKSEDLFVHELEHGSTVVTRLRAVNGLKDKKTEKAVAALAKALKEDAYWAVQAEAAEALGGIQTDEALAALVEGCKGEHPKTRRAVVIALGKFHKKQEAFDALKDRYQNDESIRVIASSAASLQKVELGNLGSILKSNIGRDSYRDIVHSAVIEALVDAEDGSVYSSLKKYASEGNSSNRRTRALRHIGTLAFETKKNEQQALDLLLESLESQSDIIRSAAVSGLSNLKHEDAIGDLRRVAQDDPDPDIRGAANEAIREIRKDHAGEKTAENAERIDSLEEQNKKLEEKISELETLLNELAKDKTEETETTEEDN